MEMIERVAKALCKRDVVAARLWFCQPHQEQSLDDYVGAIGWRGYMGEARAAIEAMLEPTSRMVSEGESAASFGIGKPADDEAIPRVWKWMVGAALEARTETAPAKEQTDAS